MNKKFYIWQNGLCISYLLRLRQMEEFFLRNGWEKAERLDDANCMLIGACAAFEPYFATYSQQVGKELPLDCQLVVYGCLPIVNREFYNLYTPENAIFIPSRSPQDIENVIRPLKVPWQDIHTPSSFRKEDYTFFDPQRRFILIQEGCTEKCYYCPHRLGIGSPKSRPINSIIDQVKYEIANGGSIFILEGNDGGSWGIDLSPQQTYPELLDAILALSGSIELHIGDFSPKWVKHYGDCLKHPQITDIKIPIQSTSSRLLAEMGRNDYAVGMGSLLKELKLVSSKLVLRTEIIIGLPTSTEEELLETVQFAAEHFHKIACFSYDFHPFTRIAQMDIPRHAEETIIHHVRIAMDFAQKHPEATFVFNERGKICSMLTQKWAETDT